MNAALLLALLAAPQPASTTCLPPVLAEGEAIEVLTCADFNGDGHADRAYIVRREDARELRVVMTSGDGSDPGKSAAQGLALDPYPLVAGTLDVRGAVLLLTDLAGGTTAVQTTHRFRWDERSAAMRLIRLDVMLYSRTYAHDAREVSWNLLSGDLIARTLRLNPSKDDVAYHKSAEQRSRRSSQPLRLEQAPSWDHLLGWATGR